MPVDLSFSLKQARRLALAAQGFSGRQAPAQVKAAHLNRLIERLGVLQIDSVNAVVRSHYLPLFSRLGHYSPLILEQAAWSQGRRRSLFEYWGHEASLMPMALYPLMRWRMERAKLGQGIYSQMARFGGGSRQRGSQLVTRDKPLEQTAQIAESIPIASHGQTGGAGGKERGSALLQGGDHASTREAPQLLSLSSSQRAARCSRGRSGARKASASARRRGRGEGGWQQGHGSSGGADRGGAGRHKALSRLSSRQAQE